MAELTREQSFNLGKYAIDGCVQYLDSGMATVKQQLMAAQTPEDLEKAQLYFSFLVQKVETELNKITVVQEEKHIK